MDKPYLTAQQLGEALQVTPATLRAKAARGEIPHIRIGRSYRFVLADVEAALKIEVVDTWHMSPASRRARRLP